MGAARGLTGRAGAVARTLARRVLGRAENPFAPSLDPSLAVRRPASEAALTALEAALRSGAPAVLLGPSGIGKSLLTRELALRLDDVDTVFVRGEGRDCSALAADALAQLGQDGIEPWTGLAARARERAARGSGLLVVIDPADRRTLPALEELFDLSLFTRNGLRLLVVAEEGFADCLGRLPRLTRTVSLTVPLGPDEVAELVGNRLARAQASELWLRVFTGATFYALHRDSGGLPSRVCAEAARLWEENRRLVTPPAHRVWLPRLAAASLALLVGFGLLQGLRVVWPAARLPAVDAAPPASVAARDPVAPVLAPLPAVDAAPPLATVDPVAPLPAGDAAPPVADVDPVDRVAAEPAALAPAVAAESVAPTAPVAAPAPAPNRAAVASGAGAPARPRGPTLVAINAIPAARLEVDGVDVGSTPIVELALAPGPYRFDAVFPDGQRVSRTVEVAGKNLFLVFP